MMQLLSNENRSIHFTDAVETPTILLEPPQFDEVETVAANGRFGSSFGGIDVPSQQLLQQPTQQQQRQHRQEDITAIDSYGNPIESLKPIDTPDGRKVVSAQGVQFEIPNYASGITDIRKPANELLPPNVGEFDIKQHQQQQHHQEINALLNIDNNNTNNNEDDNEDETEDNIHINNRNNKQNVDFNQFEAAVSYNDYNDATTNLPDLSVRDDNVYTQKNNNNNKDKTIMTNINHNDQSGQQINTTIPLKGGIHSIHIKTLTTLPTTTTTTKTTMSRNEEKLSHFIHTLNIDSNSNKNSIPLKRSQLTNLVESSSTTEPPSTMSASSTYVVPTISVHAAPLSNGNFNYPNVPTDITIINRIAAKYRNTLPTIEPIVVAEPSTEEDLQYNNVQQESIKVEVNYNQIPEYLLDLNDTNIGGPVDYVPSADQSAYKFISWDLLPPEEKADHSLVPANIGEMIQAINNRVQTADSQYSASSHNEEDTSTSTTVRTTTTTQRYNRGNVHFTNSTPAPTRTTRRTTPKRTTWTTRKYTTPTTTPRTTTTTTTTTTPRPVVVTTTESADTEYYRLENGDSYTLPPWLTGLDYADLDVAVTFIVPTDNNDYNHTIDTDIAPPLEPFLDLKDIHLPAPVTDSTTTSTKTTTTSRPSTTVTYRTTPSIRTTTTTPRTTSTTARSYWIQTNSIANTKPSSFNINNRVTPNHISQSSTTLKPKYNFHTSFNTIQNNGQYSTRVTTSTVAPFSAEIVPIQQQATGQKFNPFLPSRQNVGTNSKSFTTTTTTTTTTTPKPEIIVEENPFVPTLPSWLEGAEIADLGPAVPFVYDPAASEQNVDSDLQAPLRFQADKPSTLTDTQSQFPSNQISAASSALANTASTASTISNSKVNAPSPIQTDADTTATTFNMNNELDNQQKNIPVPFEDDSTVNNNTPVKTTFSKGQGGKVISNTANTPQAPTGHRNPFLPNLPLAASSNNIPSYRPLPIQNFAATTARSVFRDTATYKNRFGGPPGVLRPYDNVRV